MLHSSKRARSRVTRKLEHLVRKQPRGYERLESRHLLTAVAGDFNDDGFADLAVGAPGETVSGFANAGAVNVIYGGAGGLAALGNQYWHQDVSGVNGLAAADESFGVALAVGDFDGDGFDDLAIGATGDIIGGLAAGSVNILYGSASGLTASGDQQWNQNSSGINDVAEDGDQFGAALAVGDFDDDGFDDLAIGAPREDIGANTDAGQVHIIYGSAAGLTGSGDQNFNQDTSGIIGTAEDDEQFGFAVAAGDFDADGRDDLAIGVPLESLGAAARCGAVHVLYGTTGGLSALDDQFWNQNVSGIADSAGTDDIFGAALAAGDFDGNGRDDLAIGIPGEDIGTDIEAGAVAVLYGTAAGLSATGDDFWSQNSGGTEAIQNSAEDGDNFGRALAAGDFNGDVRDDLAIAAPGEDTPSLSNVGAIHVLYGTASGLGTVGNQFFYQNSSGVTDKAEADDGFGFSLSTGDFDDDGFFDVVVGTPGESVGSVEDAGIVQVLYGTGAGTTTVAMQRWHQGLLDDDVDGVEEFALFGWAIA